MDKIQVGVALSLNSEKYLEFLIWTACMTVFDTKRLHFILGLNGANAEIIDNIANNFIQKYGISATIVDAHVDGGYGSMNHGKSLDIIFQHMDASSIGMFVDCDVAFLKRGWDRIMMSHLKDKNVIVGAEYDGEKYKGFPNVICAMFNVWPIALNNISFSPEGTTTLFGQSLEIYGYPADSEPITIILDTGSELPRKLKAAGLSGTPLPLFRDGHNGAKFMKNGLRGEEYQLDGEPLFTHLGRSYTREFGVNEYAIAWEKSVREWIENA